jgi:hypothetical protein
MYNTLARTLIATSLFRVVYVLRIQVIIYQSIRHHSSGDKCLYFYDRLPRVFMML